LIIDPKDKESLQSHNNGFHSIPFQSQWKDNLVQS